MPPPFLLTCYKMYIIHLLTICKEEFLKALLKKQRVLMNRLPLCTNMIRGTINFICSRCKCSKCICRNNKNYKAYRLTYKDKNQKTKIVYVPKNKLKEIKIMISNYSKCRKVIGRMVELNIKIFKQRLRI